MFPLLFLKAVLRGGVRNSYDYLQALDMSTVQAWLLSSRHVYDCHIWAGKIRRWLLNRPSSSYFEVGHSMSSDPGHYTHPLGFFSNLACWSCWFQITNFFQNLSTIAKVTVAKKTSFLCSLKHNILPVFSWLNFSCRDLRLEKVVGSHLDTSDKLLCTLLFDMYFNFVWPLLWALTPVFNISSLQNHSCVTNI